MKKYDIIALGELLIDFTQCGYSENGMRLFEQNPGGAVANVLAAATKLGNTTAFLGKVGQDIHGRFLRQTLQGSGIDVTGLVEDPDVFTTLAFVELTPQGERNFSFSRKPGADTMLRQEEVDLSLLEQTRIFHVGSLSLTHEPARSATLFALKQAKQAGALISYDPNYRASLWKNEAVAAEQMRSLIPYVDLMKVSDEEMALVTGCTTPEQAAACLNRQGVAIAAVSLGEKGVCIGVNGKTFTVPAFPAQVVDTTGAGDAFWGGFLHSLLQAGITRGIPGEEALRQCAVLGCATASLCITKRGAIPAMPTAREVRDLIAGA